MQLKASSSFLANNCVALIVKRYGYNTTAKICLACVLLTKNNSAVIVFRLGNFSGKHYSTVFHGAHMVLAGLQPWGLHQKYPRNPCPETLLSLISEEQGGSFHGHG